MLIAVSFSPFTFTLQLIVLAFCCFPRQNLIINASEVTISEISIFDLIDLNDLAGIRFLIENGCDLNDRKYDGSTALMLAVTNNQIEIVKLLLDCSVNVNAVDNDNQNALYCSVHDDSNEEIVKLLLEHGADPFSISQSSAVDSIGAAIVFENVSIFELLCSYTSFDDYNYCLQIASFYSAFQMRKYLLEKDRGVGVSD